MLQKKISWQFYTYKHNKPLFSPRISKRNLLSRKFARNSPYEIAVLIAEGIHNTIMYRWMWSFAAPAAGPVTRRRRRRHVRCAIFDTTSLTKWLITIHRLHNLLSYDAKQLHVSRLSKHREKSTINKIISFERILSSRNHNIF